MRKRVLYLIIVGLVLLVGSQSYAQTSGTLTSSVVKQWGLTVVTLNWTSSDTGLTSQTISKAFQGCLVRMVYQPNGKTAPSDNWDCVLYDANGQDILLGTGANHDTANTESVYFDMNPSAAFTPVTVDTLNKFYTGFAVTTAGIHRLVVTNAGDAKKGHIKLYLRDPPM